MEKKVLQYLVILLLTGGCLNAQTAFDAKLQSIYKNTVPQVKPTEVREKIKSNKNVILLDARSVEEYKVSHIPGATLLKYEGFMASDVLSINHNAEIIVYCTVGYRSERLGEELLELGFTNVRNLYGGILEWVNEEGPIVNIKNQPTDSVHTYSESWGAWLTRGVKVR